MAGTAEEWIIRRNSMFGQWEYFHRMNYNSVLVWTLHLRRAYSWATEAEVKEYFNFHGFTKIPNEAELVNIKIKREGYILTRLVNNQIYFYYSGRPTGHYQKMSWGSFMNKAWVFPNEGSANYIKTNVYAGDSNIEVQHTNDFGTVQA